MVDLGKTMFDFMFLADTIKDMHPSHSVSLTVGKLDAVIS
jgi:hypothetical protein